MTITATVPEVTTLTVFAAEIEAHDYLPGFGRVIAAPTRTDNGFVSVEYRPGTSVRAHPVAPVTTRYFPSEQVTVERPTLTSSTPSASVPTSPARRLANAQPESEYAETVVTTGFLRIVRVAQSLVETYRGNAFMVQRIAPRRHAGTPSAEPRRPPPPRSGTSCTSDYPATAAVSRALTP